MLGLADGINRRFGTRQWTPVTVLQKNFDLKTLVAWYRAADICVVSSVQDGMNLVAKEFVCAQKGRLGRSAAERVHRRGGRAEGRHPDQSVRRGRSQTGPLPGTGHGTARTGAAAGPDAEAGRGQHHPRLAGGDQRRRNEPAEPGVSRSRWAAGKEPGPCDGSPASDRPVLFLDVDGTLAPAPRPASRRPGASRHSADSSAGCTGWRSASSSSPGARPGAPFGWRAPASTASSATMVPNCSSGPGTAVGWVRGAAPPAARSTRWPAGPGVPSPGPARIQGPLDRGAPPIAPPDSWTVCCARSAGPCSPHGLIALAGAAG